MTLRTVDLAKLDSTTEDIKDYIKELRAALDVVHSEIAERTSEFWSGRAESAYQERQGDWVSVMSEISSDFSDLQLAARTAHTNYSSAKNTNISMLGR